ncbi:MAG: polymer-forming cytoskeletal protein [Bacteroidetes bacterium]|nr:polymer-forming cytoskeletal protein [Bacteroidota bacterium]
MLSQPQYKVQTIDHNMEVPMVINACSKMNGELILTTDTRVDGKVFGKVESDRNIIIGTSGYIKGFLRVNNLVSFGRIEGNVIVSGTTVLHPGSSIFGNLYTKVIEVKEGAVITARVITYEKLKAFDEAQLHLAEEMFSKQSNRINIPIYSKTQIPFDENVEIFESDSEIDLLSNSGVEELIPEQIINSVIEESPKTEKLHTDEPIEEIKKELRYGPFYDLFRHEPEKEQSSQLREVDTEFLREPNLHLDEILSTHLEDKSLPMSPNELIHSEILAPSDETQIDVEKSTIIVSLLNEIINKVQEQENISELSDGRQVELEQSTIKTSLLDENINTEQEKISELSDGRQVELEQSTIKTSLLNENINIIEEQENTSELSDGRQVELEQSTIKTSLLDENINIIEEQENIAKPIVDILPFTVENEQNAIVHQTNYNEATSETITNSVLFASLLGQSIKEEPIIINGNKSEHNSSTVTSESKSKGHTIFNREELNHLFSRTKKAVVKSVEKNENKLNNTQSFLTNAIKQLPFDDFSSLYQ